MNLRLSLSATMALLLLACSRHTPVSEPEPATLPTFAQFRASQSSSTFQASPERRNVILAGLAAVQPGMPKHRVTEILGRPDWGSELAGKKLESHLGTEWTYLLSSADLNFVNEKTDQRVHVFFSTAGLVTHVGRVNLVGASGASQRPGV